VDPVIRQRIETELGRTLRDDELAEVVRLGDISAAQLDLLRSLDSRSSLLATRYIEGIAPVAGRGNAGRFAEEVGTNGQSPTEWEYRDLLCAPDEDDVVRLLAMSVSTLLAPVRSLGSALVRVPPTVARWKNQSSFSCPGVLMRARDRSWTPPRGTHVLVVKPPLTVLEPVGDSVIDTRRWIASKVARRLDTTWRTYSDTRGLVAALGLSMEVISVDGMAALGGLVREVALPDELVPGFGGPAEWYA
jgi:hypothetical protein